MKSITVAVFVHEYKDRKPLITAYTRDYHPGWDGCNLVHVVAKNGTEGKKQAIKLIKDRLEAGESVSVTSDTTEGNE